MRYTIENEKLKIEVESKGAELKSVVNKQTGEEYMWCGDSRFWGRTSPVLFPFVGDVKDGVYRFENAEYHMTSHGFARDTDFVLVEQTADTMMFEMKDDASSYVNYPFHFILQVGYVLKENKLDMIWKVANPGQDRDDQALYFSIGAHPAFNCPFGADMVEPDAVGTLDPKCGYALGFGSASLIHHHGNLTGTCTHEDICLELTDHKLVIDQNTFGRSTYIVENKQLDTVTIETPEGREYVRVEFDTPLVGIWSPIAKNAPFVCIEPWLGRADWDDYAGDLTQREYGNVIMPDELFENIYHIFFE